MINYFIKINAVVVFVAIAVSGQNDDNLLLLVSYDAFRPEHFERNATPFMNDLRKRGTYSEYMRNVFPTKTFTNHHTMSTGMHPEVHGVLGNTLYDVKLKKELSYGYDLFHYNEDIIPIWMTETVRKMDALTKYIEEKLISENLRQRMNVIYVSDHGMDSVSSPHFINLTTFLENGTYQCYGSSPVLQIVPQDGKHETTLQRLKSAAEQNGHFNVYSNDELPKRWHAKNADRIGPITAVADLTYAFQDMYDSAAWYEKEFNISMSPATKYGCHGYDNQLLSMRAIFFANGPKFKKQFLHPPFDNLDLFNLICLALDMQPTPNNGTTENIRNLLIGSQSKLGGHKMVLAICLTALALVLLVALFVSYRMYRKRQMIKHYNLDNETGDVPEGERLLTNSPLMT